MYYGLGHVSRLLGAKFIVDIDESSVIHFQESRLREGAAPKSVNEEVRLRAATPSRIRPRKPSRAWGSHSAHDGYQAC
jgi:hypothetical protein